MLKNYVVLVIRRFLKSRVFSSINIIGLSLGITCCLLISIFFFHEYNYDRFHNNAEKLYRVNYKIEFGGQILEFPQSPAPLANEVRKFEGVEKASRLYKISNALLSVEGKDESFIETDGYSVDSEFLQMFSFNPVQGSIEGGFQSVNDIILTKSLAIKYFGNLTAIGKSICIDKETCYQVIAVIDDLPSNSNLDFGYLLPFDFLESSGRDLGRWGNVFSYTYILLDNKNDFNTLNENLNKLVAGLNKDRIDDQIGQMYAQNVLDIHWGVDTATGKENENIRGGLTYQGSLSMLLIYLGLAAIILAIALINFVNLSINIYLKRIKNVGLQKAIGASRSQLVFSYLVESTFYVLIATIVAILLTDLLLPIFNQVVNTNLILSQFLMQVNPFLVVAALLGFVLICGLLSGLYPSLLISRLNYLQTTSSKVKFGANGFITRILITSQLVVAIIFIIGMIVVTKQLNHVQNLDLGFDKDQLVTVKLFGDLQTDITALNNDLSSLSMVEEVSYTKSFPQGVSTRGYFDWEGKSEDNKTIFDRISANPNFLKTSGIQLVEGNIPNMRENDTSVYYLINKKAYQEILPDFKDREDEIVGSQLDDGKVVGIVDDFMLWTAHDEIKPVIIRLSNRENWGKALIRVNSTNSLILNNSLKEVLKAHNPDYPFEMSFVDEDLEKRYSSSVRTRKIYSIGSALAIIIASLGLFGMAAHNAQQRVKEIGIRKVLGASIQNIILLMSKEYVALALISLTIAAPIAYYILNDWLANFYEKIELNITPFIIGGLITTIITIVTVGVNAIKSARMNPAETLKSE